MRKRFRSMNGRISSILTNAASSSTSKKFMLWPYKKIGSTTSKIVIRGCISSTENNRNAWLARAQGSECSGEHLTPQSVEEMIHDHRT